ncbi:hypothetical protein QA596_12355 [Balneolales bacterium ANBcel1]|nr:hypothetical protein [Balneolales bacterium ANBcel1]
MSQDKHFIQIADINASETADWNDGKGFIPVWLAGSFDGGGYVISDLYINRPDGCCVGLFGSAYMAKIANIGLVDVHIVGRESVGGIAGKSYLSDISSSFVTGSVTGDGRQSSSGRCIYGVPEDAVCEVRGCRLSKPIIRLASVKILCC